MKKFCKLAAIGLIAVTGITFAACGEEPETGNPYGELSIEDVKVYINGDQNYTFAEIEPVFTKPEKKETLTFTYDTTKLNIENNVVTPKGRTNEIYPVTAKSEHFKANFNVEVEYLRWTGAEAKYGERFDVSTYPVDARQATCQAVNAKTTLFLGDSFMDYDYIHEYMDGTQEKDGFAKGKEVIYAGMSGSTSYHWEHAYETIIGSTAPKNIVFHIGTNNFYDLHDDVEETEESLCRLMMFLHTSYPTSNIYWFNITQRTDTSYASQVTETNTYMANWCAKYDWATCVDTCSKINGGMLRDGTHPKTEHYGVFTDTLQEAGCEIETK